MSLLLALTGGGPPPADSIIGSFYEAEEWVDEDEGGWASSVLEAVAQLDFLAWQVVEDEDTDDEPEQLAQLTPGLNDFVAAWFEAEEEDTDEVEAVFAQVTASIAAADAFVQGLFEIDDDEPDELELDFVQMGEFSSTGGTVSLPTNWMRRRKRR